MYKLTVDPKRKLVLLKLVGMLSAQEVAAMYAEEYVAIRAMGCQHGDHLVLADLTECNIQTRTVSEALQSIVQKKGSAKRVAMFMGSSLAKMQARRIATSQNARVFEHRAEALDWLLQSEAPASAAA